NAPKSECRPPFVDRRSQNGGGGCIGLMWQYRRAQADRNLSGITFPGGSRAELNRYGSVFEILHVVLGAGLFSFRTAVGAVTPAAAINHGRLFFEEVGGFGERGGGGDYAAGL